MARRADRGPSGMVRPASVSYARVPASQRVWPRTAWSDPPAGRPTVAASPPWVYARTSAIRPSRNNEPFAAADLEPPTARRSARGRAGASPIRSRRGRPARCPYSRCHAARAGRGPRRPCSPRSRRTSVAPSCGRARVVSQESMRSGARPPRRGAAVEGPVVGTDEVELLAPIDPGSADAYRESSPARGADPSQTLPSIRARRPGGSRSTSGGGSRADRIRSTG